MAGRALALALRRAHRAHPFVASLVLGLSTSALLVLGLIGLELVARRLDPGYLVETRGIHVFSPRYGWKGRPGASAKMGSGLVTLNGRGYRGRELPLPRRGDLTRVVVLGDSVAFGFGVSDAEAFPELLDSRDNGLEVGNLAVEGYGPGQELLVLLREGLRLQPDLVVLATCLRNDLVDAVLPVALYNGRSPRPRFRLVDGRLVLDDGAMRLSAAERAVRWLSDYSYLFNRASALVPARPATAVESWRVRKRAALRDESYALRLTLALVLEMDQVCREHGIDFLAAAFPSGLGYAGQPQLHRRFVEELETRGAWVVDVGTSFRELGLTPAELAIDKTGHLAPEGHAIACSVLEREITARIDPARR
jgi:hypothetical protein